MVSLTDDARLYFQTEIEADKNTLKAKFAKAPQLFDHLLDHWDYGTVEDAVARTYLKTVIGLNEQSARSALGIYKDNLSFASLKGDDKGSNDEQEDNADETGHETGSVFESAFPPPGAPKIGEKVQWTSGGVDQFSFPRTVEAVHSDGIHGWFVTVVGEKGSIPMEQVSVVKDTTPAAPNPQQAGTKAENPVEVFMTADKRLRINADVDGPALEKLIALLEKYKEIVSLH